ncbi:helix-turn-helix transcriptional regulator [Kitasatospora sp. NBC_00070]|uniref:helix-turn-helix domain-containing protein n=1 Tax=Kitasatospora sp. NBC_00070 TaxID=2975962 RepID=UPI00324B7F96
MPREKELDPTESISALFGSELRNRRTEAKLSQEALGEAVGYTGSLIGQIETGRRQPRLEFAQRLDSAFDTSEYFQTLWHHVSGTSRFADYFKKFAAYEEEAPEVSDFAALIFPGMYQVEGYMWALYRSADPFASDEEIGEKVANRLARQSRLSTPTKPVLWLLVDEAVLRRPVGGPEVMVAQLSHVVDLCRSRTAQVQVIPSRIGEHAALEGAMTLMTLADGSAVAYVESPHTGQLVEDPVVVSKMRRTMDLARSLALTPMASLDLINATIEEYRAP